MVVKTKTYLKPVVGSKDTYWSMNFHMAALKLSASKVSQRDLSKCCLIIIIIIICSALALQKKKE